MVIGKKITFGFFAALVCAAGLYFYVTGLPHDNAGNSAYASGAAGHTIESFDLEKALAPRFIGDENAPVKVDEYASLTCGHCATAHLQTLPAIKERYVDSGQVKLVYNDFPLNAAALDAAVIARCLPEERYFRFIDFLFRTQDQWAFSQNYQQSLRQNAKLLGATDELLDFCLANQELRQGIVAHMQAMAEKFEISSTPTFVINDEEVVRGAVSAGVLGQAIDTFIKESPTAE